LRRERLTILEEMIFRESRKACGRCETLGHQLTNRVCQLRYLCLRPSVDVLEEAWKARFLERFLKIFIPAQKIKKDERHDKIMTYLLISLLKTSTYGFTSATSVGSLTLKIEKGDIGAPSST
jgi:hypothetical protein